MSYILRHRPDEFDLVLDDNGWIPIEELAAKSQGRLDEQTIRNVIETSDKRRFALSSDGQRVRANQGHSVAIDLGLAPTAPPDLLFHGTAQQSVSSIKEHGLISRSRQYVHLSPDRETAHAVGARHGKPVIITVSAQKMHRDGAKFYRSQNGVWLTDHVAPRHLHFER